MAAERGVSLLTKDQTKATGLWPGAGAVSATLTLFLDLVEITERGTGRKVKRPHLMATFKHSEGKHTERYSVGNGFSLSRDKTMLVPENGQTGLNDSCNAAIFLTSLEQAFVNGNHELPSEYAADGNVTAIKDIPVTAKRVPAPKRDFGDERGNDKYTKEPAPILVIDSLEARSNGAGRKAKAQDDEDEDVTERRGSKAKKGRDDDEDDDIPSKAASGKKEKGESVKTLAAEALVEVLEETPKKKMKADSDDVREAVYEHCKGHPKRKEIAALASDEDFWQDEDGWSYTGTWLVLEG